MDSVAYGAIAGPTLSFTRRILVASIRRGWRVFPQRVAFQDGRLTKRPAITGWPDEASTDPHVLIRWWSEGTGFTDCTPGIATGRESAVWVLDVDVKNVNGLSALETWCTSNGATLDELRECSVLIVETPSGGQHWYFPYPIIPEHQTIRNRANVIPGIDVRGDRGQTVAPGSIVPWLNGWSTYGIIRNLPPSLDVPEWLLDAAVGSAAEQHAVIDGHLPTPVTGVGSIDQSMDPSLWSDALRRRIAAWLGRTLHGKCVGVETAPSGTRNTVLNDAAYQLAGYAWTGLIEHADVREALIDACRANGLFFDDPDGCVATIASGWNAGQRTPLPPAGWVATAVAEETAMAGHIADVMAWVHDNRPSDAPDAGPTQAATDVTCVDGTSSENIPAEENGDPVTTTTDDTEIDQVDQVDQPHLSNFFTDASLTDVVTRAVLQGRFLWTSGFGWLRWDGRRWADCRDESVTEVVRRLILAKFQEATSAWTDPSDKAAKAYAEGWKSASSRARLSAITSLCRGTTQVPSELFDADPWILVCNNGVVDLRTGALMAHDPKRFVRKCTGVDYTPGAEHADWKLALQALPDEVLEWTQLRFGQAATGFTPSDDLMILLHGGGENGKSTILTGISKSLGDYAALLSDRTILALDGSAHPTEIMDLMGVRLATIEETPEEARIDIPRLKKIIGTPFIRARRINKDTVQFECTHTLFLSTNYIPVVSATDHGTWRRLAMLKFPFKFMKPSQWCGAPNTREGVQGLRDRIRDDATVHQAVLAWLVQGALRWVGAARDMGDVPARVQEDTQAWRDLTDHLGMYLSERIVFDPDAHVIATELLGDFNAWLKLHGHVPWSAQKFNTRIEAHPGMSVPFEKSVIRKKPGLSRPSGHGMSLTDQLDISMSAVPDMYRGVYGMRFRTQSE